MKSFKVLIAGVGLIAFSMGCDKITDPYPPVLSVAGVCNTNEVEFVTEAPRRILLEDYTGHTCGNCPGAAVEAKEIKEANPENVVVMAIHAGDFARSFAGSSKFYTDFTTETGDTWDTDFQVSATGNPNGLVNRTGETSSKVKGVGEWNGEVASVLGAAADVELFVSGTLIEGDSVCGQISIQAINALPGNYAYNIVLVEDSVVDWQRNYAPPNGDPKYPTADVPDYVHDHVLRKSFNGAYGNAINLSDVPEDAEGIFITGFTIPTEPTWRKEKLSVIGFVYNADTKEVIQVNEAHVE